MNCDTLQDLQAKNLTGRVGGLLRNCIDNGIMTPKYKKYAQAWVDKTDTEGGFCGEFWGKWFTSAAQAYCYEPTAEHFAILQDAVKRLLSAQEPDGRLSCSAKDFPVWDLWGRKYALLGLIAYYDVCEDEAALHAAEKMLDNIIACTRDAGVKITETGLPVLQAMSSCSILQPVVQLYGRTGETRYLDFAEYLVGLWSEPNAFTARGMRLLEDALEGVPPVKISSPKGYETMSCFEGVCELYRFTGKKRYLDAVLAYMNMVQEREVMLVGSGSSTELWCEGRYRQTQLLENPMETCVTATYMKLCHQLLRLTGDSRWADQLEISLYNALAGSMLPDGSWWAYFSPMLGQRVKSQMQVPYTQSSCCVVNGPRALTEAPQWAMMRSADGYTLNLYETGDYLGIAPANSSRKAEAPFALHVETAYPKDGNIEISITAAPAQPLVLALRIPHWSTASHLTVNGDAVATAPGDWCKIKRTWHPGDRLALTLDMNPRILSAPRCETYKALMYGPIVLGLDSRFAHLAPQDNLWLMNDALYSVHNDLCPIMDVTYYPAQALEDESTRPLMTPVEVPGTQLAFRVKFLRRAEHFWAHEVVELTFCDYASCGDYTRNNSLRVWFPCPLYGEGLFLHNTLPVVNHFADDSCFVDSDATADTTETAAQADAKHNTEEKNRLHG